MPERVSLTEQDYVEAFDALENAIVSMSSSSSSSIARLHKSTSDMGKQSNDNEDKDETMVAEEKEESSASFSPTTRNNEWTTKLWPKNLPGTAACVKAISESEDWPVNANILLSAAKNYHDKNKIKTILSKLAATKKATIYWSVDDHEAIQHISKSIAGLPFQPIKPEKEAERNSKARAKRICNAAPKWQMVIVFDTDASSNPSSLALLDHANLLISDGLFLLGWLGLDCFDWLSIAWICHFTWTKHET